MCVFILCEVLRFRYNNTRLGLSFYQFPILFMHNIYIQPPAIRWNTSKRLHTNFRLIIYRIQEKKKRKFRRKEKSKSYEWLGLVLPMGSFRISKELSGLPAIKNLAYLTVAIEVHSCNAHCMLWLTFHGFPKNNLSLIPYL